MKPPVIIGLGEIVWDCLPEGKKLGGAPVNFAFHAKQLGAEGIPVSAVGDDNLGREALETCREYGLCLDFMQTNDLPTSRVVVTLDDNGSPHYQILENVAWDSIMATPEVLALAGRADAICWGTLAQRSESSREAVFKIVDAVPAGAMKVFDVNLRQHYYSTEIVTASLERASVLKLNEDELPVIEQLTCLKGVHSIISHFSLDYLIYTCGASFSEVYGPEGLLSHLDTPQVKVVDTVGAGDSFTAAFITSILKGESVSDSHNKAVHVSAMVCGAHGAMVKYQ